MTRTRVDASWVVGYDGTAHELLRDACVVYEDDRVIFVGHRFDGPVDQTIDGSSAPPGFDARPATMST